jgi:type II secretory pathway pseudopilin PulG
MCSTSQPSINQSIHQSKKQSINQSNKQSIKNATDQHVLGQPALPVSQDGTQSEGQTLLAQQGVAAIARPIRADLVLLGKVGHHQKFGVARPVVLEGTCTQQEFSDAREIQWLDTEKSNLYIRGC